MTGLSVHAAEKEVKKNGTPLNYLQQLLGHTDPRMTRTYGRNVGMEDLRTAVEKIGRDGYSR
jgi:integrase